MAEDIRIHDVKDININVRSGGGAGESTRESKQGRAVRNLTRALTRFHGEFLTLLFTGMAINRVFDRFTYAAWEMTGASKMLAGTMNAVLLPSLLPVSQVFMGLVSHLLAAPPAIKAVVAAITVLATTFGWFMQFMGMALLAFFAIISLTETLVIVFTSLAAALSIPLWGAFGIVLLALIAIFLVLIVILAVILSVAISVAGTIYAAWKLAPEKLMAVWERFKKRLGFLFESIKTLAGGVWKVITGLLEGDTDKVIEGLSEAWIGLVNTLIGLFWTIYGTWWDILDLIGTVLYRWVTNVINVLLDLAGRIVGNIFGGIAEGLGLGGIGGGGSTSNTFSVSNVFNIASGGTGSLLFEAGRLADEVGGSFINSARRGLG